MFSELVVKRILPRHRKWWDPEGNDKKRSFIVKGKTALGFKRFY